jgi:cysteine-rich repeat protein
MRKPYPFYSLLTLGGLFLAGSCSIIAEVDRTKIPQDGGTTPEGGQGSGGTNGTGGSKGGSSGAGGNTGGTSGTSGEAGMGGEPGGAAGAPGGAAGAPGGMGGDGGEPPIPVCGDGTIDVGIGEECDDHDDPPAGSDGCSATCDEEPGWDCTMTPSVCVAAACGDRIVAGAEVCDDGNNNACGTCNVGCGTSTTAAAAAGSVTPQTAATLPDGATFILNDGFNPAVTFEFDSNDDVTNTATLIAIDYTTATTDLELRTAIVTAVNGVAGTLFITASNGTAPAATLTHDRMSSIGNIAITPSSGVTVVGMTGGLAGNCAAGMGCNVDTDCASNDCDNTNVCTTP